MTDIGAFKLLLNTGASAQEIAKALGISRARVYQIAEKQGLLFAGQKRKLLAPPKPKANRITDRDLANLEHQVNSLLASINSLREKTRACNSS